MHFDTLTGRVVAPWDPGYDEARLDYNARFDDIHPSLIVYCETVQDVEEAVRWARRHRIRFRIRSGRHSYEAYSILNRGLVIDVSAVNHIDYDPDCRTARIGAGAQLIDVYQTLWDQGQVTIPGGSCATVGIGGLTLGGGFGLVSRQFGLTIDAVEAIQMIDSRGSRVDASPWVHDDLFWALRGGGNNNFGVVTEFAFRTFPVGLVTIFSLQWPWSQLPQVLRTFQEWSDPDDLDRRITPILTLQSKQAGHVSIIGEFFGISAELEPLILPLLALPSRTAESIQEMTYIEAVKHFAGLGADPHRWLAHGVPDQDTFKNTSAYAYRIFSESAIRTIQDALSETPGPNCLVQLGGFGGTIRNIEPEDTAFYHRRARSEMQYQAYWSDPAAGPAHIHWVEQFRRAMLPYTVGAYVNYCDARIRDWPEAYYGRNLHRLIRTKRRWDPANLFRYPQGLSELS